MSGFLRLSDMVMYDRETESFWQQMTGKSIVGQFTGSKLEMLPARIIGEQVALEFLEYLFINKPK